VQGGCDVVTLLISLCTGQTPVRVSAELLSGSLFVLCSGLRCSGAALTLLFALRTGQAPVCVTAVLLLGSLRFCAAVCAAMAHH